MQLHRVLLLRLWVLVTPLISEVSSDVNNVLGKHT